MDKETKLLERIRNILISFPIFAMSISATFGRKYVLTSMFTCFLLLAIGLEITNVIERNKLKKKTFNGGKLYNPYRFFTVIMMIFTLFLGVLKILEAAELIVLE